MNETDTQHVPTENTQKKEEDGGFLKIFLIAIGIALVVRIFIAQPFEVNGDSMVPTFESGDYLIVDELSFHFREPERGEVVVFRFPEDTSKFFIKRIIGLPGETVEIRNSSVSITKDGTTTELNEDYLTEYSTRDRVVTLGDNEYFVMGDNRGESSDSRTWGPVTENLLIGRAIFRFLPVTQMGVLPGEVNY